MMHRLVFFERLVFIGVFWMYKVISVFREEAATKIQALFRRMVRNEYAAKNGLQRSC